MSTLLSFLIITLIVGIYLLRGRKMSNKAKEKLAAARERSFHEPVSLHPYIDPAKCIGSGACVKACPEKDIIGIIGGKGGLINASHCVGHGACAAACPVGAITLVFGTETRGVDIPCVTPNFETNIKGIFIVGELGGMGLIKNAITQGRQAADYISCMLRGEAAPAGALDLVVVGAGPAGLGASLAALKARLKFVTIEQGGTGGTVLNYPRRKIVMTSPVELPLHGNVRLRETSKEALLELWASVIKKTGLKINTLEKMTGLKQEESGLFRVVTPKAEYLTRTVVLAVGRRGAPRRLGVPGEDLPKVAYGMLDPEQHCKEHVLVVGGGDSAVEAALAISCKNDNRVTLSYRGAALSRIKPQNRKRLDEALSKGALSVIYDSNVKEIGAREVHLSVGEAVKKIPNDFVYIFAGGELPNELLRSIGIRIEKKFGTA
ncbi:MAG: NAD(P)-binding domain-containing protein [Deltaproteobacteria bacterium]